MKNNQIYLFFFVYTKVGYEMALRVTLNLISQAAGKLECSIEPFLSLSIDYYNIQSIKLV